MNILHCYGWPWFVVKTQVRLPDDAKDIHHSNSISKPFQQGYLGWLPTKSSSHAKCISQKSDNAAHKPHKTYIDARFNFISAFEGT